MPAMSILPLTVRLGSTPMFTIPLAAVVTGGTSAAPFREIEMGDSACRLVAASSIASVRRRLSGWVELDCVVN